LNKITFGRKTLFRFSDKTALKGPTCLTNIKKSENDKVNSFYGSCYKQIGKKYKIEKKTKKVTFLMLKLSLKIINLNLRHFKIIIFEDLLYTTL
jgi:hypothetical protein